MKLAVGFGVTPEQAIRYFETKGLRASWSWKDLTAKEHEKAFVVAKMLDLDLLSDVQNALTGALKDGDDLAAFKRKLVPLLQQRGWWGKQDVISPVTGLPETVQLGSASRLQTIFRTNMQASYATGNWQAIDIEKDLAPWLVYDAIDEPGRTRPSHAALDNFVARVNDPIWSKISPPNGFNCRCSIIQLDEEQLAEEGLVPTTGEDWTKKVTEGGILDDVAEQHFDTNPGRARSDSLLKQYRKKIRGAPKPIKDKAPPPEKIKEDSKKSAADPRPTPVPKKAPTSLGDLRREAHDEVFRKGKESKAEHLTVLDLDSRKVVLRHTNNSDAHVEMPDAIKPAMNDPKRRLSMYHNHPGANGLSIGDLRLATNFDGIEEVVAVTTDGGEYIVKKPRIVPTITKLNDAHLRARDAAIDLLYNDGYLDPFLKKHGLSDRKGPFSTWLINEQLDADGWIKHTTAIPGSAVREITDALTPDELLLLKRELAAKYKPKPVPKPKGVQGAIDKLREKREAITPQVPPKSEKTPAQLAREERERQRQANMTPAERRARQKLLAKREKDRAERERLKAIADAKIGATLKREKQWLLEKDKATTHEHMSVLDLATGEKIARTTDNQPARVSVPPNLRGRTSAYGNRLSIYHNHPDSSSLSDADIGLAIKLKGVEEVVAVGQDGAIYRAVSVTGADLPQFAFNQAADTFKQVWGTGYRKASTLMKDRKGMGHKVLGDLRKRFTGKNGKPTLSYMFWRVHLHMTNVAASEMRFYDLHVDNLGSDLTDFYNIVGEDWINTRRTKLVKIMELKRENL